MLMTKGEFLWLTPVCNCSFETVFKLLVVECEFRCEFLWKGTLIKLYVYWIVYDGYA